MSIPDDSALIHGRTPYDPQKAHEYYMRNRKVKGRTRGAAEAPASQKPSGSTPAPKGRPRAQPAPKAPSSRREQLEAQREMLEKRLDRLRDILAQKVKAAKARSGVKPETADKSATPDNKAAKNEASKDTKLTTQQKKDKAAKAREEYQKENGGDTSLSSEVAQLQRQIADIRAKIQAAVQDAREKSAPSNSKTASNGR